MIIYYQDQRVGQFYGTPSLELCAAMAKRDAEDVIDVTKIRIDPETDQESLDLVRLRIDESTGDVHSLLGTTNDGVQLLLHAFAQLTVGLNQANTLAQVREAAEPFNEMAAQLLAKVESGEVRLPYIDKGRDSVMAEIQQRATKVANILANAPG